MNATQGGANLHPGANYAREHGLNRIMVSGDSLIYDHNGHQFSTYDADHDSAANANCADIHGGGYWYSNCFKSNLNGKWGVAGDKGIIWGSFKDWQMYVLKKVEMKIRPHRK